MAEQVQVAGFGTVVENSVTPETRIAAYGVVVEYADVATRLKQFVNQTRVYIGPYWRNKDDARHWDWSTLNLGESPAGIFATTLASTLTTGNTTSMTLTDATTLPNAGGVWVGPNGSNQSWEFVEYESKTGNVLGTLTRETVDNEQTGTHTAGAPVRFWWLLDNAGAEFSISQEMDTNMCVSQWRGTLSGEDFPQAALRPGHLVLIQQRRFYDGDTVWSDWTNAWVGWIQSVTANNDDTPDVQWQAEIVSVHGMLENIKLPGIKVGEDDIARRADVTASTTLCAAYKEFGTGEFTQAQPQIRPGNTVDGDDSTPWISERYIGENNPVPLQSEQADPSLGYLQLVAQGAVREQRAITQFHLSRYTGQSAGYRWIQITGFADTSLTTDWIIADVDYYVNLENTGINIGEGDHVIFAENPELFASENCSTDAPVYDLADYLIWDLGNEIQDVSNGGATGGTFTLTFQNPNTSVTRTTAAITYNASATDVYNALVALDNIGVDAVRVTDVSPGVWRTKWINDLGSRSVPTMTAGDSTTGGTGVTVTLIRNGATPFATTMNGTEIFNYLPASGGMLRLFSGPAGQGQSQVVWGTTSGFSTWVPTWTGSSIPAQGTGETARMIYNPTSPTAPADFWEVGQVATPGYTVANGSEEWIFYDLPEMGLTLTSDITAISPGAGETLLISQSDGPGTDGLNDSGTIQIGDEQITYSAKVDGGITVTARGVNSTTAAVHNEGDLIYHVGADGVATTALPVKTIRLKRPDGLSTLVDFTVRLSKLELARTPNQDNYTEDYYDTYTATGHASATWELDLTLDPERIKYILVQITKMSEQPSRAKLNTLQAIADSSVYSGDRLDDVTSGDVIAIMLDFAGIPDGAITDLGNTYEVNGYTTEPGLAWTILSDLAWAQGVQILIDRDSKLTFQLDPVWRILAFAPSPLRELTRYDFSDVDMSVKPNWTTGQVELFWRTPENESVTSALFPAELSEFGDLVSIGGESQPFVYADETAADAGAKKQYWIKRRNSFVQATIAGIADDINPGDVYTVTWDYDDEALAQSRIYLTTGLTTGYTEDNIEGSILLRQLSREDER